MIRTQALIAAVTLYTVSPVAASQPDPNTSTIPTVIHLVGKVGTSADPAGLFTVTVRDAASAPIGGARVQIAFGNCSDMSPATQQLYPGVTLEQCSPPIVSAITDGAGVARFSVLGSVLHRTATGSDSHEACSSIRCSVGSDPPVTLGDVYVSAYDQDGVNGVRAHDVALWWCDYSSSQYDGSYHQRSDYVAASGCCFVGIDDFSALLSDYWAGGSQETADRCDGTPPRWWPGRPTAT